jgi:hypothetical protein
LNNAVFLACLVLAYQSKTTWIHFFGTYVPHMELAQRATFMPPPEILTG